MSGWWHADLSTCNRSPKLSIGHSSGGSRPRLRVHLMLINYVHTYARGRRHMPQRVLPFTYQVGSGLGEPLAMKQTVLVGQNQSSTCACTVLTRIKMTCQFASTPAQVAQANSRRAHVWLLCNHYFCRPNHSPCCTTQDAISSIVLSSQYSVLRPMRRISIDAINPLFRGAVPTVRGCR